MNNALIAIDKSKSYRVYLAITTQLVAEAQRIHGTTPLASAGLGRVLTGAGLMGIQLKKEEEKLTLLFKGDGPARQILATATGAGKVKGFIAEPGVDLPRTDQGKLDVGGSLGIGELTVIKDLGMKESYVGNIALVTGEIADDLTAYFYLSEQQNASVALGVKTTRDGRILASGGMIIQMLPDFREEVVDRLEELLEKMKPLTTLIEENRLRYGDRTEEERVEALLTEIFRDMPSEFAVEKLESRGIKWECGCSYEGLEKVLMTLGRKELTDILEQDGQAEMVCQFCTARYLFGREKLQQILEDLQ